MVEVPEEVLAEFLAWSGRAPHPSAGPGAFLELKPRDEPGWRFEWHPQARTVYLVRKGVYIEKNGVKCETGEPIAFNCDTYGQAWSMLLAYLRGVDEGRTPRLSSAPKSNLIIVGA